MLRLFRSKIFAKVKYFHFTVVGIRGPRTYARPWPCLRTLCGPKIDKQ